MPTSSLTPSLWETVKCDFKSLFPEDVFQMWFEPMVCLETSGDAITLGVPNDFAAIWIHDNYLDLITQRLRLTAGRMVNVTLRKTDTTRPQAALPEPEVRALLRTHGFSVANVSYRMAPEGSVEYRMVIRTLRDGNLQRLAETLGRLDAVVEFTISPTGD